MSIEHVPEAVQRLLAGREGEPYLLAHHAEAARRLARLVDRAALRQRVTMSYDPARLGSDHSPGGAGGLADSAADARRRLNRLATQLPPDCWSVLMDVCGLDYGLQRIEAERGWPRRSAKLVLRIGLDHLARLGGLGPYGQGPETAILRTWRPERLPIVPALEGKPAAS